MLSALKISNTSDTLEDLLERNQGRVHKPEERYVHTDFNDFLHKRAHTFASNNWIRITNFTQIWKFVENKLPRFAELHSLNDSC